MLDTPKWDSGQDRTLASVAAHTAKHPGFRQATYEQQQLLKMQRKIATALTEPLPTMHPRFLAELNPLNTHIATAPAKNLGACLASAVKQQGHMQWM